MSAKTNAKKAFKELEAMGVPVKSSEGYEDRGFFWISAEEENSELWLDYYSNYWGNEKMNAVLEKYGFYTEWYNPAYSCVFEI